MSISRWMLVVLAATEVSLAGCNSSDPGGAGGSQSPTNKCTHETRADPYSAGETFKGSSVTIALMDANPAPPALGDNTWTLQVTDSTGADISDATITVVQTMVDHGHHGSRIIKVTSQGGGSYEAAPVNFNMSGYWENVFHVKTATVEDDVNVKVCIP